MLEASSADRACAPCRSPGRGLLALDWATAAPVAVDTARTSAPIRFSAGLRGIGVVPAMEALVSFFLDMNILDGIEADRNPSARPPMLRPRPGTVKGHRAGDA